MKIKTGFIAGVLGIAVIAGVFEALTSPRKREEPEGKKKAEKAESPECGDCDGL